MTGVSTRNFVTTVAACSYMYATISVIVPLIPSDGGVGPDPGARNSQNQYAMLPKESFCCDDVSRSGAGGGPLRGTPSPHRNSFFWWHCVVILAVVDIWISSDYSI